LQRYRSAVVGGRVTPRLASRARAALLHLGGDPAHSSTSLADYDHTQYGPFLGVSDEGSAACQIRDAAFASPKVRALPRGVRPTPLVVGVAVDAERLGGIGELAVGPEEFADIWLACVDRVLISTNIGTRVNTRVYRREPVILLKSGSQKALDAAKRQIAQAFKPFIETPDRRPRPLTVFVDIPRYVEMDDRERRSALVDLARFVSSGGAAGGDWKQAPPGHQLGLAAWVGLGRRGQAATLGAIDLAASAGMRVVVIDGVKRKEADRAISLAGLLDYFTPGLVGPILRHARQKGIRVRTANLPDTDTIARSMWVGLTVARNFGANLGKFGCFPLTLSETDEVVRRIQGWLRDWSAAPVFFVDQGLLREDAVDVGHDLMRGLRCWLESVAARGVRVVLIDTIDKASGKRLLKRSSDDRTGFLGLRQVRRAETFARELGVRVLWAGGLGLRDTYEMGKLGVFGVYVTSAAATTVAVAGSYVHDPTLAGVKEPSKEGVLRAKILLEAGFLTANLTSQMGATVARTAAALLRAHETAQAIEVAENTAALVQACESGWRAYWKTRTPLSGTRTGRTAN
jgi:hypothetical protein